MPQDDNHVKKIFGKSAEEILSAKPEDYTKLHSPKAFCGNAGPEEMKHYYSLVGELTEKELVELAVALGFVKNPAPGSDNPDMRQVWEDMLDEADREDFYREYNKLLNQR
jgi:hypothetical protein